MKSVKGISGKASVRKSVKKKRKREGIVIVIDRRQNGNGPRLWEELG